MNNLFDGAETLPEWVVIMASLLGTIAEEANTFKLSGLEPLDHAADLAMALEAYGGILQTPRQPDL